MVLGDLGVKIQNALKKLNQKDKIDATVLNDLITDIASALLQSDVNIKYIAKMRDVVKAKAAEQMVGDMGVANLRRLITSTVVDELTVMLSSHNKAYEFVRGKPNVVMFVGLQGAGKTTTCTKFAYHYMKKGWRVGVVCADTFRAGAFTQLQMNAAKIKCPFFGHPKETDPVKIAQSGVNFFREKGYEIIIVDTSGRHKQEEALFDEIKEV
jgi:signal recognition particle subunit SRP54